MKPFSAHLALTADCLADCKYCSIKERYNKESLTTTEWQNTIAQLRYLHVSIIGLTGGEPLMRNDLSFIVRSAYEGGAIVQLFSSGIGLTQTKMDNLRDAGLWAVGISLDSTRPEAVNRIRRTPKAFDAAIAALKISQRAGLYTFINAVSDRDSVASGEYRRLYDLACRLKIHELRLIEPMPCGRLGGGEHACMLDEEQVAELRQFHRETNRRGRGPKVCAFNEIESPEMFGCAAGTGHLFIDPAGNVCPCDFTPLSFGNVRSERLETIWRRMSESLRQPRCHCFIQRNATLIEKHGRGHGFPLPPDVSCRVAAESAPDSLPGYFQKVFTPFELLAQRDVALSGNGPPMPDDSARGPSIGAGDSSERA